MCVLYSACNADCPVSQLLWLQALQGTVQICLAPRLLLCRKCQVQTPVQTPDQVPVQDKLDAWHALCIAADSVQHM